MPVTVVSVPTRVERASFQPRHIYVRRPAGELLPAREPLTRTLPAEVTLLVHHRHASAPRNRQLRWIRVPCSGS